MQIHIKGFIRIICAISACSLYLAGQTQVSHGALTAFGGPSTSDETDLIDSGGHFIDSGEQADSQYKFMPGIIPCQSLGTTGIETQKKAIPNRFHLDQNYPNPFNPSTTIRYGVPNSCHVTLTIYDLLGKEAATLVRATRTAGEYSVVWDGQGFATGIYLIRMTAENYIVTKKLILQK